MLIKIEFGEFPEILKLHRSQSVEINICQYLLLLPTKESHLQE